MLWRSLNQKVSLTEWLTEWLTDKVAYWVFAGIPNTLDNRVHVKTGVILFKKTTSHFLQGVQYSSFALGGGPRVIIWGLSVYCISITSPLLSTIYPLALVLGEQALWGRVVSPVCCDCQIPEYKWGRDPSHLSTSNTNRFAQIYIHRPPLKRHFWPNCIRRLLFNLCQYQDLHTYYIFTMPTCCPCFVTDYLHFAPASGLLV